MKPDTPASDEVVHAPHPPLTAYYGAESERRDWVRSVFDRAAPDYDRVEKLIGLGSGSWYRRQALLRAGLASGMRVVDVGTGTGLVAREAARIGEGTLVAQDVDEHAIAPFGVEPLDRLVEDVLVVQRTCPYSRRDPARRVSPARLRRSLAGFKARSLRGIRN